MIRWIGEKGNPTGEFERTLCKELLIRKQIRPTDKKLYMFKIAPGDSCYITEQSSVNKIDYYISQEDVIGLKLYLMSLYISQGNIIN